MFTRATLIYGPPAGFTVYGGASSHSTVKSLLTGLLETPASWVRLGGWHSGMVNAKDQDKERAASPRASVTVKIFETGTNISISGYRYSTSGYYTLRKYWIPGRDDESQNNNDRRRNRAELQLNQSTRVQSSLNAISEDY